MEKVEAHAVAAKVDYALMRLRQRLFTVPAGVDLVTFVRHCGHPPTDAGAAEVQQPSAAFAAVRDDYALSRWRWGD